MVRSKTRQLFIFFLVLFAVFLLAGSLALAAKKPSIKVDLLLPHTGTMPFQAKRVMMAWSYILLRLAEKQQVKLAADRTTLFLRLHRVVSPSFAFYFSAC